MIKNLEHHKKTSALILAAGNSSRMGSPKFMLRFDENHTFLEKIIEGYKEFGCNEIIVVLNPLGAEIIKQNKSNIIENKHIIINYHPELERFFSIQTGLRAFKNPENVFIHPVDNPYVNFKVLESLLHQSENSDYQVPEYHGKGGHPILISNKVAESICNSEKSDLNFRIFLEQFSKRRINFDTAEILCNINTLGHYRNHFQE